MCYQQKEAYLVYFMCSQLLIKNYNGNYLEIFLLIIQAEEAETAAVLNEYIADFQTTAAGGKTFIRAAIVNQDKQESMWL